MAAVSFCRQGVKVAIYDCMQLGDNGVMILPVNRLIEAFYSEATIDCGSWISVASAIYHIEAFLAKATIDRGQPDFSCLCHLSY